MSEQQQTATTEKAAPTTERLGPFSCRLEKVLECLSLEADSQEQGDQIRQNFLLKALYYLDDKVFDREVGALLRKGYSKRIIRAATNLIEEDQIVAIAEAILDHKLFDTPMDQAIADQEAYFELAPGTTATDLKYISSVINIEELNLEDCVFGMEDFNPAVLIRRIPGGEIIQTDSKFGQAIEKLLADYNKPQHNQLIREAYVKYGAGLIEKEQFDEALKGHRRQMSEHYKARVLGRLTDELSEMFGKIVKFGYPVEAVVDYIGKNKVSVADYNYIMQVLGDQPVGESMLVYGDEIEEMEFDEEQTDAETEVEETSTPDPVTEAAPEAAPTEQDGSNEPPVSEQ